MGGYAGKILRIHLTTGKIDQIETSKYEAWGGGHGIGSAIFFDLVKDKTIDGFHPDNVITLMTSPLSGTMVPGASGRTEMQGIGVQSYPIGWFTRSNFGGRFSSMLKFAGWDGIVLEGASDVPVWIDIRDGDVKIRKCEPLGLWGSTTWSCQAKIWNFVSDTQHYGEWIDPGGAVSGSAGQTTQRPAVLAIGPAGESLSRLACIIHDASNAAGQGGFGAVWGKKKLKAISVIGTGSIEVADPRALALARIEQKETYAFDIDNPAKATGVSRFYYPPVPETPGDILWDSLKSLFPGISRFTDAVGKRPQACTGCHSGCRARYEDGVANEASCQLTMCYVFSLASSHVQRQVCDLVNQYGVNAYELLWGFRYLMTLHRNDQLGPGKAIACDLPFQAYGQLSFVEAFVRKIVERSDDFGDAVAEGFVRAAERWGRLDRDLKSGALQYPYWGLPEHSYDPRAQLEWGYGSILSDRDINEHDFNSFFWEYLGGLVPGGERPLSAEKAVQIYADKMVPYHNDEDRTRMLDYSLENMYSVHMAKLVAWHRHYTRFWKQSALFCDHRWPDFLNRRTADRRGSTPDAEPRFYNAVTGKEITFADGMELGRRIWNLDNAIWALQGRHRDMVHFADYIYNSTYDGLFGIVPYYLPVRTENGGWAYRSMLGRSLDRDQFDGFKDRFYALEGWDVATGRPTRETLESLDLGYVADELDRNGVLGG